MWGSEGIAPHLLNLGTNGDEWSASRPGRYTIGTHSIGRWLGSRAGL